MADAHIESVADWLRQQRSFPSRVGQLIRNSIDAVLDGVHTGRYDIVQLDNVVKTHIGSEVENKFLREFHLPKSESPDTVINGVPIDIKWSITENWMIPQEAVGEPCLLLSGNDKHSVFSVGVIRAESSILNAGGNQDKKRGLSAAGKKQIIWVLRNEPLPQNLLLHLPTADRDIILGGQGGQERVNELFRLVQRTPISTAVLDTVARQRDSSKRARDARLHLTPEGIEILHGKWKKDQAKAQEHDIVIGPDEWVSVTTRKV